MATPEEQARIRIGLANDLEWYAKACLQIRTKQGEPIKLAFNACQRALHAKLQDQLKRTGRVRALVLKGRQMGISTYVAARYYHATTHRRGCRTYILSHLDDATDNLFGMVRRFHENCPSEVRPETGTASAKELYFPGFDSGYKVGTAGSRAIGRSETIQLFHGSEVAFWPSAEEHSAGIGQAIAKVAGTEIIMESTANGIGGAFHSMWKAAERGDSEFEAVFLPWFMHEEYVRAAPSDWQCPDALAEYGAIYSLTREQLYWAWLTNRELSVVAGGDPDALNWKFRREFPANSDEAFQTSGEDHFIRPEAVLRARKAKVDGSGPLVLGVDPARGGSDKMGIIDRQGRVAGAHVCERVTTSRDQRANAGHVVRVVKRLQAEGLPLRKICVDCSDGGSLFDLLRDVLDETLLEGVMFGEAAHQKEHYANRRAEMWDSMRLWLDDPIGVRIPDRDDLQGDLTCTAWGAGATHHRPNGQLVLEAKDKIRERLKYSPDLADSLALTFAVDYSELREWHDKPVHNPLGAHAWLG